MTAKKSRTKKTKKYGKEQSTKSQILSVNNSEKDYDRIFEQKLAENYKIFRELKEHHLQVRKYVGILVFILVIILTALLLLTFS